MVQKIWQMQGSSSNYLKDVAAFVKKDKAIVLPIGSVLKFPPGILFHIVSYNYLDAYSSIIRGEQVNKYDVMADGNSVSREVTLVGLPPGCWCGLPLGGTFILCTVYHPLLIYYMLIPLYNH